MTIRIALVFAALLACSGWVLIVVSPGPAPSASTCRTELAGAAAGATAMVGNANSILISRAAGC